MLFENGSIVKLLKLHLLYFGNIKKLWFIELDRAKLHYLFFPGYLDCQNIL